MELTYSQKHALYENGYVQISGVIPRVMVDDALSAINHSLGEGVPREQMDVFRAQSYCPEVQAAPAICDLFYKTPVHDLIGSVIDVNQIHPIGGGQIALRFPGNDSKPRQAGPHLDGMYYPNNGVPEGTILNFTALVGVLLSDLPEEYAGNFTVWPKTHHQYEAYFREHGAEALLSGMPPIDMPEPLQITGKAGDVVIAHYTLAHGVTMNMSANVRYAIFFRIRHTDIAPSNWQQSMENIWMHWSGMKHIGEG